MMTDVRYLMNAAHDLQLRRHLESVVQEVFFIMMGSGLDSTDQETSLGSPNITALIGMTGSFNGAVSVRCEVQTARVVAARMLGLGRDLPGAGGSTERDAIAADALGEVCNMIAGAFKARVCEQGERCMLSIPSAIIGTDYQFRVLAATDRTDLTFMLEGLPLWVSLERRY